MDLPYYNSTSYPLAVKEQLAKIPYTDEESKILRYHQFVVKEFFTNNTHLRGLLLCHAMGMGKTKLAVSIATEFRDIDPDRKIVILLSKSLENNFRNEIKAYTKKDEDYIDSNYKFVSLNAGNMFKQVSNIDKSKEDIEYEAKLGDFVRNVNDNSLNDSLLIVDEAHNLFNAITNGAKNATALYDLIMESVNLKLIFMTGTPIINDPFELVPCYNMLRGQMLITTGGIDNDSDVDDVEYIDDVAIKDTTVKDNAIKDDNYKKSKSDKNSAHKKRKIHKDFTTVFSEDIDEFEDFFVDHVHKTIKNKDKFINRIYGLTSYYGDLYFATSKRKEGFPEKLPTIIEKVHMSELQFARYISARIVEQEETKRSFSSKASRFSSSKGGSTTYRVKSRQISNYCIPDHAITGKREKHIERITAEELHNTDVYSPKMGRIINNIMKHPQQVGIVYSQFVSGEGIAIFAKILETHGYVSYDAQEQQENEYGMQIQHKKYAILTGDIDPDDRTALIRDFNSVENISGQKISLLLLSSAVAEGIDLKRIRHVHIMEPFWNYARINQVETRAIRYLSHADLPPEQQNVQVYIYLSDYPKDYPKSKIKEPTTDIDLYNASISNMKIINEFLRAMAESSFDCPLHKANMPDEVKANIHCRLCAPTNQQLFHPLLNKDMLLPNTCQPYVEKKLTANEIVLEETGDKYYYRKDTMTGDISLYYFNKKLNGYTSMQRSHPHYGQLMSKLTELS